MKISPARTTAFDILLRIQRDRAHSSALLAAAEDELSPRDRSLCHEIVMGTLRRQMLLDRWIDVLAAGKKLDVEVRIALRMAIYQIRFLDKVPDHSSINESVSLVQRAKKTSAKGMVNALLRRFTRESLELHFTDEVDRISAETSHPRWLIEKWMRDLGHEEARDLASANNTVPPLAFRPLRSLKPDNKAIIQTAKPSRHVENCYIAESDKAAIYRLAADGEVYVQDEASQMAARAIGYGHTRILDVCAAPGGKAGLISSQNAAFVVAGDLNALRAKFLQDNCRRQGESQVAVVQYDAENELPFVERCFDAVLVDAPCSGSGTIRHNPEIRYFLKESDITELSDKQLRILKNASKLVSRGGLLVFSTCSVEPEEGEAVCDRFLDGNEDFVADTPLVPVQFMTVDGFARTFPHRDNMDGFFIAAFRRK